MNGPFSATRIPRDHEIETGEAGVRDLHAGKAFPIMPNYDGICIGDTLIVDVMRMRDGYDAKCVRSERFLVTGVCQSGVVCEPIAPVSA